MCSTVSATLEQVLGGVGGLDEEVVALVELRDRVDAALVERVGVFDATELWKADGEYSFASWLRSRADVSRSDAHQLARFARTLRTMPVTEAAVEAGKLSVAKARLLAGAINERTRHRFDAHEAFLVEQVQDLDVDATKIVLGHWKRLADTDGPDPGDPTRNRASMTTGIDGRWHLEADLDPAAGAIVRAALTAIIHRMPRDARCTDIGDDNTTGRRMGEAVTEMAIRSTGANPDQAAVHPDIVVVVPHRRLTEPDPDPFAPPPEIVGTGPVTLAEVFRLALLGTVSTMTTDTGGRPLHLGRKQRLATADQWIALRIRDRGCVAPGCDRPADWCQAHHLRFWEHQGGTTDLDNLCLACSHHHHLIHDKKWTLHQELDGTWHLTRPDGTQVNPPRHAGNQRPRTRPRDGSQELSPPDVSFEAASRDHHARGHPSS